MESVKQIGPHRVQCGDLMDGIGTLMKGKQVDCFYSDQVSHELQVGKAGEHLVCCDLICQGYQAFLSDQGLNYDVLVDFDGRLYRGQVKTTQRARDCGKSKDVYRYSLKNGRDGRRVPVGYSDFFAFVVLEPRVVAYLSVEECSSGDGCIKATMDFRTKERPGERVYSTGAVRHYMNAKFMEDYSLFERIVR